MNAVLSLAVILIASCILAFIFFLMAVSGEKEQGPEPEEIDPIDYSEEEEYYR